MESKNKHWHLYVLRLEDHKYYIGITTQTVGQRLQEHLHGRKSYWTEKYPPLEVFDTKDLGITTKERAETYENKVTRKYMRKYGINNVRGGDLTAIEEYAAPFGWIFYKRDWQALLMVAFLTITLGAIVFHEIF